MKKVLIVDDKEENLYYLESLLTGHDYQVETARHGAEALVKARKSLPDVVISDLLMPVMDGYTLLRHWKADPRLHSIPFIVYTATYTEAEDERLALNLGADAFILKPAEPEDFLARLREVKVSSGAARARRPSGEDPSMLRVYSETLIRKLEEKTLQLEEANKALQADIADRERTAESLRESEQRFRQLAENIHEVFWMTDPAKQRMLYVSPAYEQIWGRSCQSLCDAPDSWFDSIHPDDRARVRARVRAAAARQASGAYDESYRIRRPDGSLRWIRDRAYPVADETGAVYRIVGTAEDITERKKLEAQFLRAQRMESIGTLAGGIAHDLNNILAPILLSIEILRIKLPDPESSAMLDTLQACANRGADLVRQVLSFARGVDGQRVAVNLRHLADDIQKIVTETFPKKIEFQTRSARDLWPVLGDPTQLHQVLMNLCVNARDAMPSGGRLTLTLANAAIDEVFAGQHADARPGPHVAVEVADTGTGIPPEAIDKIFEPFFTTKEPGQGTGLGLSTTQAIVKSHHGFIDVRSKPGEGTVFKLWFSADQSLAAAAAPAARESLPRGVGQCILVVDDEAAVRAIAQRTLEQFGYRTLLAANGAEAVSVFVRHRAGIDLAFVDMTMPVMDGPATIAALRSVEPGLRIIGSSGFADQEVMSRAQADGVEHFISKPFTAEALLVKLHEVLGGKTVG
jgi:PAS domain S-box-containing protein